MSFYKSITFGFEGYPNYKFSFDYMLVFINQLGEK